MKKQIIFPAFFIFLISCNQQSNTKTDQNFSLTKNDSLKSQKESAKNNSLTSLFPKSDTLVLNLKIDSADQHITIPVKILDGNEIFASLSSSDKNANIRINQIGLPDSTFDGPFGKDFYYKIKMPGIYQLIIAEDMMAGDRWKGDFLLKVWVQ